MHVAVVTNFNGRGLERDAEVVEALVARAGHESERVPWASPRTGRFDLVIFLEVAPRWAEALGTRRWLIPNPEWWHHPGHGAWLGLEHFERVLCKTREARRIFGSLTQRASFSGFASRDRHLAVIPRERRFLCVAGVSVAKGADAVVRAWELFGVPHRLTVVGRLMGAHAAVPNVEFLGHVDDEQLRVLQNACLFHLQPSWTEGFGVTAHEALSCGAVLLTTDAPPMHEIPAGFYAKPSGTRAMNAATAYRCRPQEVHAGIESLASAPSEWIAETSSRARCYFEESRSAFEHAFLTLLQ